MIPIRRLAPLACGLLLSGCAVGGFQAISSQQPVERQALAPEYRIFYDSLVDQGRWTLIEPWGYVFKPDVNFVAWSPYQDGFWVPSDVYGWVWISNEPFGWAVYHYGRWAWDEFQGWVWIPGLDWGPGWVSWEMAADHVGWAPLLPAGVDPTRIPGGIYRWAPIQQMGSTGLSAQVVRTEDLGAAAREARPAGNVVTRDGVTFDRGPSIALIERRTGPLQRVKIEAVDPLAPRARPGGAAGRDTAGGGAPAGADNPAAQAEAARRAGTEAARRAATRSSAGGRAPAQLTIVRPAFPPREEDAAPGRVRRGGADDAGRGRGGRDAGSPGRIPADAGAPAPGVRPAGPPAAPDTAAAKRPGPR